MAFVKLDCGILDSSLWTETADTRIVFVTLLAMADESGFVHATRSAVVRRANLPEASVLTALEALSRPDANDRSGVEGGRRIEEIQGGFNVVNYERYRNACNSDVRKANTRERVARYRSKKKAEKLGNPTGIECNAPVTECNTPSPLLSSPSHLGEGMQGEGGTKSASPTLPKAEEVTSSGLSAAAIRIMRVTSRRNSRLTVEKHVDMKREATGLDPAFIAEQVETMVAKVPRMKDAAIWDIIEAIWPTPKAADLREDLLESMGVKKHRKEFNRNGNQP